MYPAAETTVLSLVLDVNVPGNPQCLLDGSEVTLTCNIIGFPRPRITFRKNGVPIVAERLARVDRTRFNEV